MTKVLKKIIKFIINKIYPSLLRKRELKNYINQNLPNEFAKHLYKLDKNCTVIDIGANVGLVTECLARTGAYVICFEPDIKALTQLKKVSARYKNIEVHECAAGIKEKEVKLFLHKNVGSTNDDLTQASSLKSNKPNISKYKYNIIKEIDFVFFLSSINKYIELIKIDIEGYEIELINHLIDNNSLVNIGKIYLETHERKFKELEENTLLLKKRIKDNGLENKFFFEWP